MTWLVDLADVGPGDRDLVGGKAARLGGLIAAGLPVPQGFCVTTAVYDEVVVPRVAGLVVDPSLEPGHRAKAIETIGDLELPAGLVDEIRGRLAAWGADIAVAVRSSAPTEDGAVASFAGQFATTLRVRGVGAVVQAVRACWASAWGEAATRYAEHRSSGGTPRMAVLVQPMIEARCAGVAFLPATSDCVVLEAVRGTAEGLVDGTQDPVRFDVDLGGGVRCSRDDGPEMLAEDEAREVAALVRRVAMLSPGGHDVEWAWSGGSAVVLQDRPITAEPPPAQPLEQSWVGPVPGAQWARMSICDSWLPGPLSPLFATTLFPRLVERWARNWGGGPGNPLVPWPMSGTVHGYAYLRIDFPLNRHPWRTARLVAAWLAFHLSPVERRWRRDVLPAHVRGVGELSSRSLVQMPTHGVLAVVAGLETLAARYWAVIGGLAWYWNIGEWALGRVVVRGGPAGDGGHAVLLQGADSRSWRAEADLHRLARMPAEEFAAGLASHLQRYGHLVYDLDIASPTPAEQPDAVLAAIDAYRAGLTEDPRPRRDRLAERSRVALRAIRASLRHKPLRRAEFEAALAWCRHWTAVRDEALHAFTLPWPALRAAYLELGRRLVAAGALESPADVFFLTGDEIRAWAHSSEQATADWAGRCAERRAEQQRRRRLVPPPLVPADVRVRLGSWDITAAALFAMDRGTCEDGDLRGHGVSAGRVQGPVRVVRKIEEGVGVGAGDVLVVSQLTPAWCPLLTRVAAVVTDVGGALSHGSIVAREFGVPAVMGTGNATRALAEGQVVLVDGTAGTVRRLDTTRDPAVRR